MRKQYEELFMEIARYENRDIICESIFYDEPVYSAEGNDDFGYDFWE